MSNLTSIASLASGHLLYWAFVRHLDGFRSSGMLWLRLAVLILLFTSLRRFMYCVGSAGWSFLKLGLGISCFTFLDTICCVAAGRLYISSDPPATLNQNIGGDKMRSTNMGCYSPDEEIVGAPMFLPYSSGLLPSCFNEALIQDWLKPEISLDGLSVSYDFVSRCMAVSFQATFRRAPKQMAII